MEELTKEKQELQERLEEMQHEMQVKEELLAKYQPDFSKSPSSTKDDKICTFCPQSEENFMDISSSTSSTKQKDDTSRVKEVYLNRFVSKTKKWGK